MYGQLAHRNASPKKQLPQLLVAFGAAFAACINLSFSSPWLTSTALPSMMPSNITTLPFRSSSASSSASPQLQFLHARLRLGVEADTGSHVGTGRALSAAVSSASGSMEGVDGASGERAQRAFFFAGSVFLRLSKRTGPEEWAGFWAIIAVDVEFSSVNPDKVKAEVNGETSNADKL
jgi:hypothetical protein